MFNCHIAPGYFMDEMQLNEVEVLIDCYNKEYRDRWEQTRYLCFVVAAGNGARVKKPKDLITFGWEREETTPTPKPTAAQLKALQKEMTNSLNNYNTGQTEAIKL